MDKMIIFCLILVISTAKAAPLAIIVEQTKDILQLENAVEKVKNGLDQVGKKLKAMPKLLKMTSKMKLKAMPKLLEKPSKLKAMPKLLKMPSKMKLRKMSTLSEMPSKM